MFERFVQRENDLFDALQRFVDAKLDFIVIGGYGVSAYQHRFSVDVDMVIQKKDLASFEEALTADAYVKTTHKELDHVYASLFLRYLRKRELPVSVDLLVDGVGVRQTGASFIFH